LGRNKFDSKLSLAGKMPRSLEDFAVFSAPAVFVVLWASGFIGAKFGLPYAEPMTFLSLRMIAAVALLAVVTLLTRPKWPDRVGLAHSAITGTLVHGLYLGGVFASIENGISAGLIALIVSLQPVLTSTIANRWLGERVLSRQWLGLLLGLAGVYLIVRENIEAGTIKPIAWVFATTALAGITVGTLYQKRFGGGIDWRPALCVQYATAGTLFVVAALIFETRIVHWTPQFLFAVAWLVLMLSVGAVWLLYFMIRHSAATRVVSFMYLTPPVTALMAWIGFNERLAPLGLVGMAICVTGVFLVNWRTSATSGRASRQRFPMEE
jgi:drug/metabolite transporter (DMT)-like permease